MITSIKRELTLYPNIVSIISTDSISTITTAGYFESQSDEIERINNGAWQWETLDGIPGNPVTDIVVIYSSPTNNLSWYNYNIATDTFSTVTGGALSPTLQDGYVFVGNNSNIATPYPLSSDLGINNSGALALTSSVVANAQISLNNATDIPNMYATPVQLLPAPGANKLILIEEVLWFVFVVLGSFSGGGAISLQYGNTAHGAGPLASGPLPAATLNAVSGSPTFLSEAGFPSYLNAANTACLNAAVYLSNLTAPFVYGGSGGITSLFLKYRIFSL